MRIVSQKDLVQNAFREGLITYWYSNSEAKVQALKKLAVAPELSDAEFEKACKTCEIKSGIICCECGRLSKTAMELGGDVYDTRVEICVSCLKLALDMVVE